MFNVIEYPLNTPGAEASVVAEYESFVGALSHLADEYNDGPHVDLRPLVHHEVAALSDYRPLQAWEVRIDDERSALVAIQEA